MTIQVHHFEGNGVGYQVLRFENHCLWIWIGSSVSPPELNSLSLSLDGKISSSLLGVSAEFDPSDLWASKLSKRLGKPVFISVNLSPSEISDPLTQSLVLKRLFEELKKSPEFF